MKNIILIILLINSFKIFSQNNYKIEYQAVLKLDEDVKKLNNQFGIMQNTEEDLQNSKFFLEFNNKESFFYSEFPKEIESKDIIYLYALSHSEKLVYTSLDSLIILKEKNKESKNMQFFLGKEKILIQDKVINNWEITSETKKIDNYICFKAINYTIEEFKNKQIMRTIIAWFCPEIPLSFGHAKYSGLPGLIFEVSEGFLKYELKKIETVELLKYEKPKGKRMTFKEYFEMFNKKMNDVNEMAKSIKKE